MTTPLAPSHAFHDRFNTSQSAQGDAAPKPASYTDSNAGNPRSSADAHLEAAAVPSSSSALPDFPEFKSFDNDQDLFQSNYFEQFAPSITTPVASLVPQSAEIEDGSPEIGNESQSTTQQVQPPVTPPQYDNPAPQSAPSESEPAAESHDPLSNGDGPSPEQTTQSQLERHFSSASSYVSRPSIQQHVLNSSPPSSQTHANASHPLPVPPVMPTSPSQSADHSSPPVTQQQASINGHSHAPEAPSLQSAFVFPPRNTSVNADTARTAQSSSDHNSSTTQDQSNTLPLDSMRISDSDHAQPNSTSPLRNNKDHEDHHRPRSSSFYGNQMPSAAINASGQQVPVSRNMIADDDGFYQHQDLPQPTSEPSFFPNGIHQPQPRRMDNNVTPVPRPSSFFGGDNDAGYIPRSEFSPTSAIGDDAVNGKANQITESVYRGISTAAGGTGNGPMPSASSNFGGLGSSASTRPASIAPSTTSGPLLDHSHLKVGQKASLLSHGKTLELYRQNAKKTNDPNLIYELAVFMIDAAKTIGTDDDVPTGATPGPAPKVDGQKEELIKEATGLLKKIADRGHPDGQYFLADCYANGVGTKTGKQDFSQAYTYFVLAAKHGHPDAAYRAGTCYEKGWGCRKDAGKALQFFRKSAAQSHPGAMYRLATAELNGELGLKKNAKEGVKWLKRSAETATPEFPHALHELALLHERGIDNVLFVDPEYSCELLAQAGEMGYAPSAYKLGVNYEYGRMGCPQDGGLSIHMYNIAAQQNHKEACFALTAWYLVGAPGILPQSDTEAYLWAKKAAEQQLAKAEYAVGYFTEMGIGTIKDVAEAKAWYKRAADHGDKRATQRIAALQGRAAGPQSAGINRQQQRQEQRQEQRQSMHEFGRRGQPTSAPFPASFAQSSMTPSTTTNYPSPIAMREAQTAQREQQYMANVAANERSQARGMLRPSASHGELASPATGHPSSLPLPRPPMMMMQQPSPQQQQQQQQQQQGGAPPSQAYPSYPLDASATSPKIAQTSGPHPPILAAVPPAPVGHVPMQPAQQHAQQQSPTPAHDDKKKKKPWFSRS